MKTPLLHSPLLAKDSSSNPVSSPPRILSSRRITSTRTTKPCHPHLSLSHSIGTSHIRMPLFCYSSFRQISSPDTCCDPYDDNSGTQPRQVSLPPNSALQPSWLPPVCVVAILVLLRASNPIFTGDCFEIGTLVFCRMQMLIYLLAISISQQPYKMIFKLWRNNLSLQLS